MASPTLGPPSAAPHARRRLFFCRVMFMLAIVASTWGTLALESALRPAGSPTPVYVLAAVPFFLVQIMSEWVLLTRGRAAPHSPAAQYEAGDTWASLSSGAVQIVWRLIGGKLFVACGMYAAIQRRVALARPWDVTDGWWVIPVAFILKDFEYYVYHRLGHQLEWLWAGHSVHHSSDRYNLATALRQSWQQALVAPLFSVPLWAAFSPSVFITVSDWVTLYQFWVHTCIVRRMGAPLEYVLVTPSHHRVHHDRRVHKNFGGVFIVWDRLGGTFVDEGQPTEAYDAGAAGEPCVFGVREGYRRFVDPVAQLRVGFLERRWKGPGFYAATAARSLAAVAREDPARTRLRGGLRRHEKCYLLVHSGLSIVQLVGVMTASSVTTADVGAAGCALVASLVTQGLVADRYRWAWAVEVGRLALMLTALRAVFPVSPPVVVASCAVYSASIVVALPKVLT